VLDALFTLVHVKRGGLLIESQAPLGLLSQVVITVYQSVACRTTTSERYTAGHDQADNPLLHFVAFLMWEIMGNAF
jgi:hypothetical protein